MYTEDITKQVLTELKQCFEAMCTCLDTFWVEPGETPPEGAEVRQGTPTKAIVTDRDWLVYKCHAALRIIGSALQSRLPAEQAISDVNLLFKEMRARSVGFFAACQRSTYITAESIEECKTQFECISTNVYFLCLIQADTVPQVGFFLQIYYASQHMADGFGQVLNTAQRWADHWGDYFYGEDLSQIEPVVNSLVSESDTVKEAAFKAAMSCELETMQESREILCTELPRIYDKYYHLTCRLDRLRCSPDVEPTFYDQVYANLNQTGQYVANALQGLQMISLAEENWVTQLERSWKAITQQVTAVRDAITNWADQQLCPPPDQCLEATQKLVSCTKQAVQQLTTLQGDCLSCTALDQQADWVKCVNDELVKLTEQTANLTHFDQSVFDKFWWPIAQIRVILSRCEKEEEPCVLTKDDLAQILQGLQKTFGEVGCRPVYDRLPTCITPQVSTTVPVAVETVGNVALYGDVFKQSARVVLDLEGLVAEPLKPQMKELESLIQRTQRQLQPEEKPGVGVTVQQVQRARRRWEAVLNTATVAVAVTQERATETEKQRLAELEKELERLDQRIRAPVAAGRQVVISA